MARDMACWRWVSSVAGEGAQVAGHLEQEAGGFVGCLVAVDDAVDGVWSVAGDAEESQGCTVEDGGVARAVVEADGVGRGGGVEVLASWGGGLPCQVELVVAEGADAVGPWGVVAARCLRAAGYAGYGVDASGAAVELHEAGGVGEEVDVGVVEAGSQGHSLAVEALDAGLGEVA